MNANTSKKRLSREERKILELQKARMMLILSWVGFILIMIMMIPMWFFDTFLGGPVFASFFVLFISTCIIVVPGNGVLKSAWSSARYLSPNMHVLTTIGAVAALITGALSVLYRLDIFKIAIGNYAGLGGMIMTFHLSGLYIEKKLRLKASQSIKALISLQPKHATILKEGKEDIIPVTQLQVGDVVVVKTGEKIPSDGVIIEGEGDINESLITGESTTVYKTKGDTAIGGAINTDGRLLIKIEKMGKKTFLQQVITLVEQAQGTKPQIQLVADKVTAIFVPIILVVASLSFLAWTFLFSQMSALVQMITNPFGIQVSIITYSPIVAAILSSIAVLVVACPCALGLATPSAIAIGVGRGSQLGALIKNPTVFEKLKHADYIAMDKTGTITEGKPQLVGSYVPQGQNEQKMFYYAAVIENTSHHPLSQAVISHYKDIAHTDTIAAPTTSKVLPGSGLWGIVDDQEITISNTKYLRNSTCTISPEIDSHIHAFEEKGHTVSIVIKNTTIIGIMSFVDVPKQDSFDAISRLRKMKLEVIMVTGDNHTAAEHVATQMKITQIIAQATPEKKLQVVQDLQSKGHHVVMVGDGINDAPALTQAHIGVAMGNGTDVAAEAGDIILIKGTLPTIVSSLQLSRKAYRIITQNLFWAFFYNLILIPLAIFGLVHPIFAEIAMGISSITVLFNSIRLSRFQST